MKPGELLKSLMEQKKIASGDADSKEGKAAKQSTQKGYLNVPGNKVARVGRGAARGS